MGRIVLQYLFPFILPFIAYFGWRLLMARGQGFLKDTPWYVLTVMGLSLSIVSLIGLALVEGGSPDGVYVPPHVEDGRIVPGRVEEQ
ncbi:MAG: hypothetical protein KDH19_00445 [Geminicoccaceae bacterium]|nr:hypothetical protein [Geminicoccaceae bacterium]